MAGGRACRHGSSWPITGCKGWAPPAALRRLAIGWPGRLGSSGRALWAKAGHGPPPSSPCPEKGHAPECQALNLVSTRVTIN